MSNNDKNSLITLGIIVGIIVYCVGCIFLTRYIPYSIIAGVTMAIYHLFVVTTVCKMYYKFFKQETGIKCYIPIVNSFIMFDNWVTTTIIIESTVLAIVYAIATLIPFETLARILGEKGTILFNDYIFLFYFLVMLIIEITYSIGLLGIYKQSNQIFNKLYNRLNKFDSKKIPIMVLIFIPIIRIIPAFQIYFKLKTCVDLNGFTQDKAKGIDKRLERGSY